ncbi:MAG: class D sortase [Clostridia bacterium]|nr:class D sortase [Clostridia bacterium]
MTFKFNFKKLTVHLCVPLAFAILGYCILFLGANSTIKSLLGIWDIISSESDSTLTEADNDIYTDKLFGMYEETIPSSVITFPLMGTKYAEISIESTALNCSVFFGDSPQILRKGAGHYAGSSFAGFGSTVLISGHNNRYFDTLKDAQIGSIITLKTNYGIYTYRITHTAIKKNTDRTAYDLGAKKENIVLYTCYPFNTLGLTSQRYFVYGEYVSGPKVLVNE